MFSRSLIVFVMLVGLPTTFLLIRPDGSASPPAINKLSFDRIRIGMTEKEVVEILGCKPGNYATRPLTGTMTRDGYRDIFLAGFEMGEWACDSAIIQVAFHCSNGKVFRKWILPAK